MDKEQLLSQKKSLKEEIKKYKDWISDLYRAGLCYYTLKLVLDYEDKLYWKDKELKEVNAKLLKLAA